MNVSATLNFFRLIRQPSLCLPHATVPTFNDLPVPLTNAFGSLKPDIRAVVLDKDNCFAVPKEHAVYKPYAVSPRDPYKRSIRNGIVVSKSRIHDVELRLCTFGFKFSDKPRQNFVSSSPFFP